MLKKLYEKSKIWFALSWIIAYCVLMSLGDMLSAMVGLEKSVTLGVGVFLSGILLIFLKKNALFETYGLRSSEASLKSILYYAPLLLMLSVNLWYGVTLNYRVLETVLYILSMLCVGFLEEMIFRGFLFGAMREENFKAAVVVSGLTFGIGHIINLLNGSGIELIPNLVQVVYATTAGFMFVMLYVRTKSLIVCILAHGVFNALGVFANEGGVSQEYRIIVGLILAFITGSYAVYLALRKDKK